MQEGQEVKLDANQAEKIKQKFLNSVLFLCAGILLLITLFLISPEMFRFQSLNKSRDLYRTAREYQKNSEYKEAFYAFSDITPSYDAYDAVLLYQGKCAAELEDEKTAVLKLKKLISRYRKSPFAPQASYNIAQAYIRMKNPAEAEKQFLFTIKNFPETDFAKGSYYYLGELEKEKDKLKAAAFWLKYLEESPSGRFAAECSQGIITLGNLGVDLSIKQKKILAVALYNIGEYSRAIKYLKEIPQAHGWYYLSRSYEQLGNKSKAAYYIKEGLKQASLEHEKRENFEAAMLLYVSYLGGSEISKWDNILSFASSARDFALFKRAEASSRNQAVRYYWEIVSNHPAGNYSSEALWNVFYHNIRNPNRDFYSYAIKLGEDHLSRYKNTKATPAVMFWLGKIYERRSESSKAIDFYKKVLVQFPDSYWAFRSEAHLESLNTGEDRGWNISKLTRSGNLAKAEIMLLPEDTEATETPPLPYSEAELARKYGKSIFELIKIGDYETVSLAVKDDGFLQSWLYLQQGVISRSIVIARNSMDELSEKPPADDHRWKLVYPLYFTELVNSNSRINNIDPYLALSIMREESYFNTFALSSSNARGLMQLLPGTAKDIARWKNLGNYNSSDLFYPEINIRLGTAYLSYVKSELLNNSMFAVAAYNGGPGAVQSWINGMNIRKTSDLDEFVEDISYEQTRTYVKKVFRTAWNYKRIY